MRKSLLLGRSFGRTEGIPDDCGRCFTGIQITIRSPFGVRPRILRFVSYIVLPVTDCTISRLRCSGDGLLLLGDLLFGASSSKLVDLLAGGVCERSPAQAAQAPVSKSRVTILKMLTE